MRTTSSLGFDPNAAPEPRWQSAAHPSGRQTLRSVRRNSFQRQRVSRSLGAKMMSVLSTSSGASPS